LTVRGFVGVTTDGEMAVGLENGAGSEIARQTPLPIDLPGKT
jgi:hypothetical protein